MLHPRPSEDGFKYTELTNIKKLVGVRAHNSDCSSIGTFSNIEFLINCLLWECVEEPVRSGTYDYGTVGFSL